MSNKIIKKGQIVTLLNKLAVDYELIAPVQEEENIVNFKPVSKAEEVTLDFTNSIVPPKDYFFPQTEKMFNFNMKDNSITELEGIKERVIFGIRPCDVYSLLLLDPVFDGQFKDTYYLDKRGKSIVIALSCNEVGSNCFCNAFGGSPTEAKGADLLFTELGDKYLVEVLSERGEKLVKDNSGLFTEYSKAADEKQAKADDLAQKFVKVVDVTGVKDRLDNMFEHPYWEELAKKCIGCGICTYVCPTCHCFDICDKKDAGYEGHRFRCWDSCMFSEFTSMAHGNPRPGKTERVRNRFMHKLKYHLDRYELNGCAGCGRCLTKCPVNMDITKIISEVKDVK